jgi:hypothetical protein
VLSSRLDRYSFLASVSCRTGSSISRLTLKSIPARILPCHISLSFGSGEDGYLTCPSIRITLSLSCGAKSISDDNPSILWISTLVMGASFASSKAMSKSASKRPRFSNHVQQTKNTRKLRYSYMMETLRNDFKQRACMPMQNASPELRHPHMRLIPCILPVRISIHIIREEVIYLLRQLLANPPTPFS